MPLKVVTAYIPVEKPDEYTSPNTIIHTKKTDEFIRLEEKPNSIVVSKAELFELLSDAIVEGVKLAGIADSLEMIKEKNNYIKSLFE